MGAPVVPVTSGLVGFSDMTTFSSMLRFYNAGVADPVRALLQGWGWGAIRGASVGA
ncbi:MAG: hypothetical protein NVSMB18_05430 [Acetobacteraceae bacterium]